MKSEIIQKEKCDMVVMDVKIDNFICFRNFHMNMSYPKKIVGSYIENEFCPVEQISDIKSKYYYGSKCIR